MPTVSVDGDGQNQIEAATAAASASAASARRSRLVGSSRSPSHLRLGAFALGAYAETLLVAVARKLAREFRGLEQRRLVETF